MVVALGMASVVSSPCVNNLETLRICIAVLAGYSNGWGKRKVTDGSYLFERLVLPKYLTNAETIIKYLQENPNKDPRVVWQMPDDMTPADARSTNTAMANTDA